MAFEVFDDVAFYWFLFAAMFAFVIPMTRSFWSVLPKAEPANWTRGLTSNKAKMDKCDAAARKLMMSQIFGWRGVGFTVGWVLFISLAIKLSSMEGAEMFTFNPYKILGVEEGSEMSDIKKAYRKLSLQYHPDKNQGDPTANDLFIKVAKAYEVLTDDATRENYEKYGNPDGYHGTSVTIGLPSWLTNKDNEMAILIAYFVIMIVVIPIITTLWWRNSSKYLEDGVMQDTAFRFYKQLQETTASKFLPGILASAVELCEGAGCKNATAEDLGKLHRRVSSYFVKNQGDVNNDIMKVKTLLYAHLLREPVPASLAPDMEYVLEHAHKLLNGLFNMCTEQRFVTATVNVVECSQLLTQALWFHSNQLMQLPHFDEKCIKLINKVLPNSGGKAMTAIEKVKELGGAKRREVLPGLNEEQHLDIDLFLSHFPDVEVTYVAKTEDEEDVQEGDVLSLNVKIERRHLPDEDDWEEEDDDDEPTEELFESQLAGFEKDTEEYEEKYEELMDKWRDAFFERERKKRERQKQRNPQSGELGFAAKPKRDPWPVHAPFYPFERHEQWLILLVDQKTNKLVDIKRLTQNTRHENVDLKFLAPKEGVVQYDIHCMCSAYLGADKKITMKKEIKKKVEEKPKTAAEVAEDEDDEEEEDEEEPEGKWYYLGGNSVTELILNIIALGIAGVMLFNFLYAKGWWQKFFQPFLDWLLNLCWPFLASVGHVLKPGWDWWTTNVYDFHHVAILFENLTVANDTNASISLHVKKNDTSFLNQDPFKQDIFAEARENL